MELQEPFVDYSVFSLLGRWKTRNDKSCLTILDETLLALCVLSVLGVFSGIFVVMYHGQKLYQQSHYTGRTGMVSVGKDPAPPISLLAPTHFPKREVTLNSVKVELNRPSWNNRAVEYVPTPDTLSCISDSSDSLL